MPTESEIRERMFAAPGGAIFVLLCGDCVLMERCPKKGAIFPGVEWFIPGGKIEPGETAEAACRREALEELGVRLVDVEPLSVADGAPGGWEPFALHPFLVREYEGDVPGASVDGDSVPLRWVPMVEAVGFDNPAIRQVLVEVIERAQNG